MLTETKKLLKLAGLNAPFQITDPEAVLPRLAPVLAHWPQTSGDAAMDVDPFATLGPTGDGRKWRLAAPLAKKPEALHDPVDGICDLIVEMSWERLRSRPELLCLHAAAIDFGGKLVLFPNTRRGGKSLLSATLAHLGLSVFTDDFVPLAVDHDTRMISGLANGISPRLRLPLPDNVSPDLSDWIMAQIGVRNKRYGYMTALDLPASGTELPVGGIVLLHRDMTHDGAPRLDPVSPSEAIDAILVQNFGRQVHAGAILAVTRAMAHTIPVWRLTYRDVEPAAEALCASPTLKALPEATLLSEADILPSRAAPIGETFARASDVALAQIFGRVAGYTEVETEQAIYLAAETGLAIHKLNPVSGIIWKLCAEEGMTGQDLVQALSALFPDVHPETLKGDVIAALRFLVRDGLLAPMPPV